jgi:hypothetical protein
MSNNAPEGIIKSLIGKSSWEVMLGAGSVLTLEFGVRDPRQSAFRIHGEWRLWLYDCAWRLECGGSIVTASQHERSLAANAVKRISGIEITDITLTRPGLDLEITFQNQCKLRTFAATASEDHCSDQWVLFTPQLITVAARGDQLITEPYGHLMKPEEGTR